MKFWKRSTFVFREVSSVTGCPEMLNGRVKTLHPAIHAGILARNNADDEWELKEINFPLIRFFGINFYDFL